MYCISSCILFATFMIYPWYNKILGLILLIASKMGLLIASILCNSNIEIGFLSRAIDTRGVVNHDVYHVFHGTASSLHSIRTLPPWPWSIPPKQSLTGGLPLPRPLPRYGSVLLEQSLMATYRGKKPNILEPPWGHSQKSLHLKKDQSSPLPRRLIHDQLPFPNNVRPGLLSLLYP